MQEDSKATANSTPPALKRPSAGPNWVKDTTGMVSDGVSVFTRLVATFAIGVFTLLVIWTLWMMGLKESWLLWVTIGLSFLSLVVLWWSGRRKTDEELLRLMKGMQKQILHLSKEVEVLEDRLTDAEILEDFEDRLARKQINGKLEESPFLRKDRSKSKATEVNSSPSSEREE